MKKIILFSFSFLAALAVHAEDFKVDSLNYSMNPGDTSVYVARQSIDLSEEIEIPDTVIYEEKKYAVTSIGVNAFNGCTKISSVKIPSTVTSIGSFAFYKCKLLSTIKIPSNVTMIGEDVFQLCTALREIKVSAKNSVFTDILGVLYSKDETQLITYPAAKATKYVIPEGVTTILKDAFKGCSQLTSVTISKTVTTIGAFAFYGCSGLTSISIPKSVTSIGGLAFGVCSGLSKFAVSADNLNYSDIDGVLFNKKMTQLIVYPAAKSAVYRVPNGVKTIAAHAFSGNSTLSFIILPDSVTTIGNRAFALCTALNEFHTNSKLVPVLGDNVFEGVNTTTCKLLVPTGSYNAYKNADGWNGFTHLNTEAPGYLISSSCGERGSVSCDKMYVNEGSPVTFTIITDEGFEIASAILNGKHVTSELEKSNNSTYTYKVAAVSEDLKLSVSFARTPYTEIYIDDMTAAQGSPLIFPIKLKNTTDITAFQLTLTLPAGVTFAKDKNDEYLIKLSDRASKSHSIKCALQADGSMMIMALSMQNAFFSGSEGDLIYVTVNVADDKATGDYTILMDNVILTEKDKSNTSIAHEFPQLTSKLTIREYTPGDSNGDGQITILDAVNVLEYMLDKDLTGFVFKAADKNGDSVINIVDVVGVIDAILNPSPSPSPSPSRSISLSEDQSQITDLFEMDPFSMNAGETKTLALRLNNSDAYTAFQMDIELPAGLSVAKDADGNPLIEMAGNRSTFSHVTVSNEVQDGKVRIIGYSMSNSLYKGNEGDFLYITLKADERVESGTSLITVDNIHMVTSARTEVQLSSCSGKVAVNSITAVDGTEINQLSIVVENGVLIISTPEAIELPLYSVEGRLIKVLSLNEGSNSIFGLNKGIYLIHGMKVII